MPTTQPTATPQAAASTTRVYRVRNNDGGYVSVREEPSADSAEVAKVLPGWNVNCESVVKGQLILCTDQWAYCPGDGDYILLIPIEPV